MSIDTMAGELAREKQEVQRLRDLLIVRDQELGAARGELAELDERSKRLLGRIKRLVGLLPSRG